MSAHEIRMRHPERNPTLHAETEFAQFAVIKAVVVSDKDEFGIGHGRLQVEARILGRKPLEYFRIRKKVNVLDSLFVDGIQGKVKR